MIEKVCVYALELFIIKNNRDWAGSIPHNLDDVRVALL